MPATLADIQAKYGDSVYPLYKDQSREPYMESENGSGYQGVIMYSELEDKIQCSICGKWYQLLGTHIKSHKISAGEYRKEYQLPNIVPLATPSVSSQRRDASVGRRKRGVGSIQKGIVWSDKTLERRAAGVKRGKNTMWFKNKYGLCPAQKAARLAIVVNLAGVESAEELTTTHLLRYDKRLYSSFKEEYGTIVNACKALGFTYKREHVLDDAGMIAKLRSAVLKFGRIPKVRELKIWELPSDVSYANHFGSWRRAKMMAGLDQLLQEIQLDPHKGIPAHLIVGGRPNE